MIGWHIPAIGPPGGKPGGCPWWLTIIPGEDGTTVLTGGVADQAALYGLIARIRDLGLPLVSIQREAYKEVGT